MLEGPRTARSSVLRDYTSESCAIVAHRDTCQVQIVGNENNAKSTHGKRGCNFHRRVIDRLFRPFNFMRSRAAYVNRSTAIALEHRCSKIPEYRKCMADCDRASNVSTFEFQTFFFKQRLFERACR